jgi:hypothetical protein
MNTETWKKYDKVDIRVAVGSHSAKAEIKISLLVANFSAW